MSGVSRILLTGGVVAAIAVAAAPRTAAAQVQLATYVCQTPRFWCAFQWAAGHPNGTGCYCMTYMGPVNGYSINPAGVANAPPLPPLQNPTPGGGGNPVPPADPQIPGDDCYNGLGNCPGSFRGAVRRPDGSGSTPPGAPRREGDPFAAAIERILTQAPRFEAIKGDHLRSSRTATRYRGTMQLPGFSECTVVEDNDGDRRYHCDAPRTSFSAMVDRVAGIYGRQFHDQADEPNFRYRSWSVGDVEITVWDDDEGGSYITFERLT